MKWIIAVACVLSSPGYCQTVAYPRQDLLKVEVETRIDLVGATIFQYSLTVRSLPESTQEVWQFGLDVPVPAQCMKGWQVISSSFGRRTIWSSDHPGFYGTNWFTWITGMQPRLQAGEEVSGLSVDSAGLPGIRPFLALGKVDVKDLPDEEDLPGEETPNGGLPVTGADPIENSYHTVAVGPEVLPETLSNEQMLDRLIALKDKAAGLGWIKDPGVVTSLNRKLANVRKELDRWFTGKKTARNMLGAFISELDALRGKQVDENAYWLLKANAQYLIYRLGGGLPKKG